ncbi:hypothetical protein [Spirosoma utsteinense]|uniref:Uncharacterized protein n=1 Tax=Spirosoma utsteinense TaxID=2585773 RepID=A0ABR6W914_9BACT|nr:hypothetical protein [Spirosoma utsteinense]MBC3787374.1 hypothetical protein [Spirosoma utsteinense]MBC3793072.1 hypothetical protein [Spirosoma utsteinense]
METVFDYNPTQQEIDALGFLDGWLVFRQGVPFTQPVTIESYRATITPKSAQFDLVLLFEYRGDQSRADKYAAGIWMRTNENRRSKEYARMVA